MAGEQFAQIVVRAACGGNPVYNMFWYVNEDIGTVLPYALAEELAVIFADTVIGPLAGLLPQLWVADSLLVSVFSDSWALATTPPFEYPITQVGAVNTALPGRRLAALFRAQLQQPAFILRSDGHQIKTGRLMVGPIWDGLVNDVDMIVSTVWPAGNLAAFLAAAAQELFGGSDHTFHPIRVSDVPRDAQGQAIDDTRSAAKVVGWTLRPKSTTQKQRAE